MMPPVEQAPVASPRRWWPVVWIAVVTVAVEAGAYLAVRAAGASGSRAALATLAVATVWVALAAPVFAAGGRQVFEKLLRGGAVIDVTGLVLMGLWLVCPSFGFASAVKVYAVLASMGLAGLAVVCCVRSGHRRLIAATVVVVVTMAALTTPLWGNGLLIGLDGPARQTAATGLVAVNPAFSIAAATARDLHWVWNEAPRMYQLTILGQVIPVPSVSWYVTPLIWLGIAGLAGAVGVWRGRAARPAGPADPPAAP